MSDLERFPQPEWNDSGTVSAALDALRDAPEEPSAQEARDAFLWAVGYNPKGTYHQVVLGVVPELKQILVSGHEWPQCAVMELLIDLGGSFIPEKGHANYLGASVEQTSNAIIHSMRRYIAPLATGLDARARSAVDLLKLIDAKAV